MKNKKITKAFEKWVGAGDSYTKKEMEFANAVVTDTHQKTLAKAYYAGWKAHKKSMKKAIVPTAGDVKDALNGWQKVEPFEAVVWDLNKSPLCISEVLEINSDGSCRTKNKDGLLFTWKHYKRINK